MEDDLFEWSQPLIDIYWMEADVMIRSFNEEWGPKVGKSGRDSEESEKKKLKVSDPLSVVPG